MQTDTINLWANCSSGFMSMLFFCPVKLGILLSLALGWPVPLQGLNDFRTCLRSYLWCLKSCIHSRQSGHSKSGQRSALLCLWSLNKTIDLISLTAFFHATGHLFVYFGEMSVLVFCLFFCWVVFLVVELYELFVYILDIKPSLVTLFANIFFHFVGYYFHFVYFLCCAKTFKFD